ncbi:MAG: hypothetical protein ABI824_17630 [Acidobacteriota bacterium]
MRKALLMTLLVMSSLSPIFADTIFADGIYHEFLALNLGGPVQGCAGLCLPSINPVGIDYSVDVPWTFTGPGKLLVLDLFLSGDQYEVFDNGVSLGLTSAPGPELQCGLPALADIQCSIDTSNFSRGTYVLGSGAHSITINYLVTTSVHHSGAAIQLSDLPEPASGLTCFASLLAIGFGLRRVKATRAA